MPKLLIILLSMCCVFGCTGISSLSGNTEDVVPDTSKAVALGHPDGATIKKLHGTLGSGTSEVLARLGHPSKVSIVEGKEKWNYPWLAAAYVVFKDGVVVDTFYTAGY